MMNGLWKLLALLSLVCGPLAASQAQPVQAMAMADCGEMPIEYPDKSSAMNNCIAGCAMVIPLSHPVPVQPGHAEAVFGLPAKSCTVFSGEVVTPPPK